MDYDTGTKEDMLVYDYKLFLIKVKDKYLERRRNQVLICENGNTYKFVLDNLNIDIKAIIETLLTFNSDFIETVKAMKRYNKEAQFEFVKEEVKKMQNREYLKNATVWKKIS